MAQTLTGISSMATRLLLNELASEYRKTSGVTLAIESVGGVDAAKRVQRGEAFDLVFLAAEAIDRLTDAQRVVAGSRVDIAKSGIAVAVRKGTPHPRIDTEDALKQAVLSAKTIGYSTGPSGVALQKLFECWGIAGEIAARIVQATPGVPVGSMVAGGDVELGFQQLSELLHVDGIDVIGPLPAAIQITTTFSGGVCATSTDPDAAAKALAYLASPAAAGEKQKQGMEPAY